MKSKVNLDRIYLFFNNRGLMGNKNNLEIERRFLVAPGFNLLDIPEYVSQGRLWIQQRYLRSPGKSTRRIRKVTEENGSSIKYFLTEKKTTKVQSVKVEIEREIQPDEYQFMFRYILDNTDEIEKLRVCFWHVNQLFEMDFFKSPARLKGLVILEIELENPDQKVVLPDFIPIACEITGSLSNSQLAKRPR